MTTYNAISTETGNKGTHLGTSKRVKMINGKLEVMLESKEDFEARMKTSTVYSFEVIAA